MENRQISFFTRISSMFLEYLILMAIMFIMIVPIMLLKFGGNFFGSEDFEIDILMQIAMLILFSIYFNKDVINGKNLAKKYLKIEVVDIKTNQIASPLKCLIRNLTIMVWPIEIIATLLNPNRRIGDYIAGTKIEPIDPERNLNYKKSPKKIILSFILSFIFTFSFFYVYKNLLLNSVFEEPEYIESTYNKESSETIEKEIKLAETEYFKDISIEIYDSIKNDTLHFISATFKLKNNCIEDDHEFKQVKKEAFDLLFELIKKENYILYAKFEYKGKFNYSSTASYYDWRDLE